MTSGAGGSDGATASLLWEACHRRPDAGALHAALDAGADAGRVVALAARHRVSGLLWRAVVGAGLEPAFGHHAGPLAQIAEVQRLQEQLLVPLALRHALVPLLGAGFEPVVLKGPAVAARYPAPGLRPMEDLDVLMPRAGHERAVGVLRAAGWRVARRAGRDHYDTVLVHPEVPSMPLELHHGLDAWHERYTGLDARTLWERRVRLSCHGVPAFGLPIEEQLVQLAVHAGKPFHHFGRLIWTADLAMVAGGVDVDWGRVARLAREWDCRSVVAVALELARRVGLDAASGALAPTARGWRRAALSALSDPLRPLDGPTDATFHVRFALADRWWRRALLALGAFHGMPWPRRAWWPAVALAQGVRRWRRLRRERAVVSPAWRG